MNTPFLGKFHYPMPTQEDFMLLMLLLLLAILGLTIWLALDALRDRRRRLRKLADLLAERMVELHLTPGEAALLEKIARAAGAYPSLKAFEEQVERLLRKGVDAHCLRSLREKMGYHNLKPNHQLLSSRECSIGQDVTLTDARNAWKAGILAVDETALTLKVPPEAARILKPDADVKVSFWRELDARYFFETTVRYSNSSSVVSVVRLDHPSRMERFQDRDFYRADVDWKIRVMRLDAASYARTISGAAGEPVKGDEFMLTLIDISPGGFRALPVEGLAEHDHLVVTIPVSDRQSSLALQARVISAHAGGIRCEFMGLTLWEQDALHHEILKERRRMR